MNRAYHRNYKYFWSLLPGLCVVSGNLAGGWWVLTNFVFSIGILAFIEWFFPEDKHNETDDSDFIPDSILILHVFMQVIAFVTLYISIHENRMAGWQYFGAALSVGVHSGTSSIVIAHEMIHRKNTMWQWLGKFLLFTAGNVYFFVEHLKVHHKWVGTAKDPATARFGESLPAFYLRTTAGQIRDAWKLEKESLKKENKSVWNMNNYVFSSVILQFIFCVVVFYFVGKYGLLVYLLQCIVANFLLEYTNYIEHYGLSRNENERVNETISWQTDKVISRFFLIDLSRHSDHHYYASKPFHELQTYERSPVLPGGYASAIYMALIPPIWFRVVNKRLKEYEKSLKDENILISHH